MVKKLADGDLALIHAAQTGEGCVKLGPGDLERLAKLATNRFDGFVEQCAGLMTPEKAEYVRWLRVDQGCSWRAVALQCFDSWDGDWSPPSNQLMGMALCEAAAEMFGEDYYEAPWN